MKKLDKESDSKTFTTSPLAAALAPPPILQNDPEFVDVVGLRQLFGIKRSLAYVLLADGAIRSVSLRRRGTVRGKRLFDVQSVREFLRSRTE